MFHLSYLFIIFACCNPSTCILDEHVNTSENNGFVTDNDGTSFSSNNKFSVDSQNKLATQNNGANISESEGSLGNTQQPFDSMDKDTEFDVTGIWVTVPKSNQDTNIYYAYYYYDEQENQSCENCDDDDDYDTWKYCIFFDYCDNKQLLEVNTYYHQYMNGNYNEYGSNGASQSEDTGDSISEYK